MFKYKTTSNSSFYIFNYNDQDFNDLIFIYKINIITFQMYWFFNTSVNINVLLGECVYKNIMINNINSSVHCYPNNEYVTIVNHNLMLNNNLCELKIKIISNKLGITETILHIIENNQLKMVYNVVVQTLLPKISKSFNIQLHKNSKLNKVKIDLVLANSIFQPIFNS